MPMTTTILLERETRLDLKAIGKKGETYNDIIVRLIKGRAGNELPILVK